MLGDLVVEIHFGIFRGDEDEEVELPGCQPGVSRRTSGHPRQLRHTHQGDENGLLNHSQAGSSPAAAKIIFAL